MRSAVDLWEQTVQALQATVKPYDFMHWIEPIRCVEVNDDRHEIVLDVPDDSHGLWIEENFLHDIREMLKRLSDTEYRVEFRSVDRSPTSAPVQAQVTADAPIIDPPELIARYHFGAFVDGPQSRFALTAARAVAERLGTRYNPLFLYGGVGLGKTHLLHAIGHAVLEANPRARVHYVTSETYVNDLIAAIRNNEMNLFRVRYRDQCDLLLIDDIQFIAGKDRTQEEFFHMFNTLYSSRKQIVMTSDQSPHTIPDLEERLRSRLQMGLIADIKPPCFETRVAILKRKAEDEDVVLEDDVAMLLARHITHNVRELEGALLRLEAHARIFSQPIDLALTREVLGDLVDPIIRQASPASIMKAVAQTFQVSLADLKGPRRHRHVTVPRQAAMYLIRELTDASLPHIGSLFGGRDHTTVINALRRIGNLCQADPILRERIDTLRRELIR